MYASRECIYMEIPRNAFIFFGSKNSISIIRIREILDMSKKFFHKNKTKLLMRCTKLKFYNKTVWVQNHNRNEILFLQIKNYVILETL